MKFKLFALLTLLSTFFFSCDKDDREVVETLITLEAQTFEVLESLTDTEEIGQISAVSNMTDPITYRIIQDVDELLSMTSDGVLGLASGRRFNFRTAASHQIIVEATDGKETATATITINVVDVPDPFISTWKTDEYGVSEDNQITISTIDKLTYNYSVDWGDGTEDTNVTGTITHTYPSNGTYTVSILGTFPAIYNDDETDSYKIQTIEQWGDIQWGTMEDAFKSCEQLVINALDVPNLSQVISMNSMFADAVNFTGDLSNWDVSNVTDMIATFTGADAFESDLSAWDVSNVTEMQAMFSNADLFNGDISSWDVSNVTDMSFMFRSASAFQGNIDNWDVSNVTDMGYMLYGTPITGDFSNWDVSSVTNMSNMFRLSSFDGDISDWNVSNVTTMRDMFRDSGLSSSNYSGLLSGWSNLTLQNGVELGLGNLKYESSMQSARDILTNTYSWNITDGGAL